MELKRFKYFYLLFVAHIFCIYCKAQALGAPIINVTFGVGNSNPNTIGAPLQTGATNFIYSTELCPPKGHYTVVRRINILGCFNDEWIPLSSDNTPFPDDYGLMMLVNNSSESVQKLLFVDTIRTSLCSGTEYKFSAAIINVDKPSPCTPDEFPQFIFNVETTTGQLIKSETTPGVGYASSFFGYKFGTFGPTFIMPPGINEIVLKIIVDRSDSYNDCGEDFAIDDIQLSPIGPEIKIGFDGVSSDTRVTSVCFQDNKTISMSGGLLPGNFAIQWQQSIDNGIRWTDIPGATNYTYSQSFPTPDTFLFRLRASIPSNIGNPNCSSVSNIIKVEVDGIPTIFNATNNSPICAGQDLIFNAEGGASYKWTGPNGFSETSPFPHIFYSTLGDSGLYYVQIITVGGCRATDSTYVTMIGVDVHTGPDTFLCMGQSVQLQASGGTRYLWSPANSLSNARSASPKATPETSTTYSVTVTDEFGCSNTGSVVVKLLNSVPLKAAFSSTEYICPPVDSASFKDMSQGEIASWNWDFSNGQTSLLPDPPKQKYFISATINSYPVRLTVTDTAGCTDTTYHAIKVAANCYIAVPTAFTPNGDGLNDYLHPLNAYKATNLLFRVFNRYGQLIFETKDWTKYWDGTYRGVKQSTDIFIWTLDYMDAGNKKISLRGTTALIR